MRHQDWPLRLAAFLEARKAKDFEWGVHDCALFAADWVLEATGVDYAERFRGRYKTAKGAAGALRRFGAGDLAGTVTAALGPPVPVTHAQRGDLLLIEQAPPYEADGPGIGICVGRGAMCLDPVNGLYRAPLSRAGLAWRVR